MHLHVTETQVRDVFDGEVSTAVVDAIFALAANQNRILAIKLFRDVYGTDLRTAKLAVEHMIEDPWKYSRMHRG